MPFVALFTLLALALPACATEGRKRLPSRVRVPGGALVLPTERCGDWFLVDATIDGEGPFRLMIDSGAEFCVLHREVAGALEGRYLERFATARGSGGGSTPIERWVRVERLQVGEFEAGGLDLAVMDLHALTRTLGTRLDGILGYSTFAGVLLTIDYGASEVRVEASELPPPDGDTIFGVRSETRPVLPLELSGRVLPVLLDTGQRGAFAVDLFDELPFVQAPVRTGFSLGTDGRTATRAGRLDGDVRLGRHVIERPILDSSERGNRVGAALLRQFVVTFDPLRRRVRLVRDGDDAIAAPPKRGFACGFAPHQEGWEIVELYEGSPLVAADVRPGDVLVGLDGVALDALGCDRWGATGGMDEVSVTFRRGDGERTVVVPMVTTVR